MSTLTGNVLANYGASAWSALMGFLFVPLYIHFLGVEAYGLMGVFATLQSVVGILDLGLSATLNRELARLSVEPDSASEMRDLVRTLEMVYWAIAVLIGLLLVTLAPLITSHWVNAVSLKAGTLRDATILMGISLAFQWPLSLYGGGLLGLQHQTILSAVNSLIATARGAGGVFVLWAVNPSLQAFFTWQLIVSAISTPVVAVLLWRSLPPASERATFSACALRKVYRFAAGLSGISVTVLILTQMDKALLSRLLTLEMFGYYMLAWTVAANLYRIVAPAFAAIFPRLTQLVAAADEEKLRKFYHQSCQFISVTVLPATVMTMIFAQQLLAVWIRNPLAVDKTHVVLTVVLAGTALNGLMWIPYGLQLAHGWTSLALYTNIVAILVLAPLLILLTHLYGVLGGAIAWATLNLGYVLIQIHIMHRRLLPNDKWQWYLQDIGLPLVAVLAVCLLGRGVISVRVAEPLLLAAIGMIALLALLAATLAAPHTRRWLLARMAECWSASWSWGW